MEDTSFPVSSENEPAQVDLEEISQSTAENVDVANSFVMKASANHDMTVIDSLSAALVAGHDLQVSNSVGSTFVAGGQMHIQSSAGLTLVSGGQSHVENSRIGILSTKADVTLVDSQVFMTSRQALIFGAALGGVFALLFTLLRWLGGKQENQ